MELISISAKLQRAGSEPCQACSPFWSDEDLVSYAVSTEIDAGWGWEMSTKDFCTRLRGLKVEAYLQKSISTDLAQQGFCPLSGLSKGNIPLSPPAVLSSERSADLAGERSRRLWHHRVQAHCPA